MFKFKFICINIKKKIIQQFIAKLSGTYLKIKVHRIIFKLQILCLKT